jgi:uncharacterized protein YkwD
MKKLSVWDVLAFFTVIATILLVIVFASIFTDSASHLNPFPNPTVIATIFIPSVAPANNTGTTDVLADNSAMTNTEKVPATMIPSSTITITSTMDASVTVSVTALQTTTFTPAPTAGKTKTATMVSPTRTITGTKTNIATSSFTPTKTVTATFGSTNTLTSTILPTLTFTITNTKQPTLTFTPKPTSVPKTATPTTSSGGCDGGDTAIESAVLSMVNYQRAQAGVAALSASSALFSAARNHSQDMAMNNFFSHTGSNGSSPFDRMASAGFSFSAAAENIYAGNGSNNSASSAVGAWMGSEGHRTNMLNPAYTYAGVGYWCNPNSEYGGYFTLDLAKP